MEIKNCRQCGRLYNFISGGYYSHICPNCRDVLEEKFQEVKKYIEEHKLATVVEISEANDVTTTQIERWVREERLTFSEDSVVGIGCEKCGVTIKTGRFCDSCRGSLMNTLGSVYRNTDSPKDNKRLTSNDHKMRYL